MIFLFQTLKPVQVKQHSINQGYWDSLIRSCQVPSVSIFADSQWLLGPPPDSCHSNIADHPISKWPGVFQSSTSGDAYGQNPAALSTISGCISGSHAQSDETTFTFGKYFSSSCYSNLDYNYKVMGTQVNKESDVFPLLSMMEFIAIHGDWLGNIICPKMCLAANCMFIWYIWLL